MQTQKGGELYKQLQLESVVADASPHKLISLLFNHTRAQLKAALVAHQADREAIRRDAISKAVDCLSGLADSLNFDVSSELPYNLHNLYLYMQRTLIGCQRDFSEGKVNEVLSLLETLADAWAQIEQAGNRS
ncbi:flagellar export chaperone FliS [Simiduia aestuariiviva]|uniref:Flagellar secretion chaperone FliS n=1 Tax=Simiduia aestuariiviva TaxID=1510459 RepID=A0A839UNX0_9GAMM|nr:flagellar export chaperone FliS [Simiduia aestuariiviva]MBB3168431.1 flagellar protein FliS [Simiduia aestuariiviva]